MDVAKEVPPRFPGDVSLDDPVAAGAELPGLSDSDLDAEQVLDAPEPPAESGDLQDSKKAARAATGLNSTCASKESTGSAAAFGRGLWSGNGLRTVK